MHCTQYIVQHVRMHIPVRPSAHAHVCTIVSPTCPYGMCLHMCVPSPYTPACATCACSDLYKSLLIFLYLPVQHAHAQICTTPYLFVCTVASPTHLPVQHVHAQICTTPYSLVCTVTSPTCLCNMRMLRSVRLLTHLSVPSLHPPACATCACSDLYDSLLVCSVASPTPVCATCACSYLRAQLHIPTHPRLPHYPPYLASLRHAYKPILGSVSWDGTATVWHAPHTARGGGAASVIRDL